jgi:hypothetical protein
VIHGSSESSSSIRRKGMCSLTECYICKILSAL